MAYAWFICPYITAHPTPNEKERQCAMNTFNAEIFGEGGAWDETEVLGDVALVKVRASETLLTTIQNAVGFVRVLNHWVLTDLLSDLTTIQRSFVQNKLLSMGYSQSEINAAMGSTLAEWQSHTYGDLLNLVAARRLKPLRWNGEIVEFSSTVEIPKSVSEVDRQIDGTGIMEKKSIWEDFGRYLANLDKGR